MIDSAREAWPNGTEAPTTRFSATSDDGLVTATATAHLEVIGVKIHEHSDPDAVEVGIVQAVNRALQKAEGQPVDEMVRARDDRMSEFTAIIDSLSAEVARVRLSSPPGQPRVS